MIKSVGRIADILDMVGAHPEGLTHMQISKALSIPHSSLFSLLSDLVGLQFLSRDQWGRLYKLGPQSLVLAGRYLSSLEEVRVGRPFISQLMKSLQESVILMIPKDNELLFTIRENGPHHIASSLQIGESIPLYVGPSGRAILSHLSDDEIIRYLDSSHLQAFTRNTIIDKTEFIEKIYEIRREGVAVNYEELKEGIVSFGVAVRGLHGKPVAGIDVAIPKINVTPGKSAFVIEELKRIAFEFSIQLGWREGLM